MAFVRVYTGDDGQSHLEDLDLLPADLPDFEKLMLFAATNISFKRLPDGYFLDFHGQSRPLISSLHVRRPVRGRGGEMERPGGSGRETCSCLKMSRGKGTQAGARVIS